MKTETRELIEQLPIIPPDVLKAHHVHEKHDNRFRAAARLLQALWRERNELPVGTFTAANSKRRIGSLLTDKAAEAGRNFLSPEIAEIAKLSVAYQEPGAMVDRDRLFGNMLSSHPLAINLWGPLCNNLELAAQIFRSIIPGIDLKAVIEVRFEHSPGRANPLYTGDRSAFDFAVAYERGDGKRGLIAVEMKYSEDGNDAPPTELSACYAELARSSGLFKEPDHAALRVSPLQQLFREHLLAQAVVMRGDYAEAHFLLIAPRHNHLIERAARLYRSFLAKPGKDQVRFHSIELEQVIEAYGWAGEEAHAVGLFERYVNWQAVDDVVREALKVDAKAWLPKPTKAKPAKLIDKAA